MRLLTQPTPPISLTMGAGVSWTLPGTNQTTESAYTPISLTKDDRVSLTLSLPISQPLLLLWCVSLILQTQPHLSSLTQSGECLHLNGNVPGSNLGQWMANHYNKVGCKARLKSSFDLNPVTKGNQGTFPFLIIPPLYMWMPVSACTQSWPVSQTSTLLPCLLGIVVCDFSSISSQSILIYKISLSHLALS